MEIIDCTSEYKYFGLKLSDDCSISRDMTHAKTALNKNVVVMLRQLGTVDFKVEKNCLTPYVFLYMGISFSMIGEEH